MRVLIDAHTLGSGQGGDETMCRGVLAGLASRAGPADRFPILLGEGGQLPPSVAGDARFPVVRHLRRLPGVLHFPLRVPAVLAAGRVRRSPELAADLLFAVNHGPVVSPLAVALMIQDLSFLHRPDFYPPLDRVRLTQVMPRQARRARAVLTVSEFCRQDLIDTLGLPAEKVFTIPNAIAEPPPFPEEEAKAGRRWLAERGVRGPFLAYLGNLHARKNVPRLIRAFSRARAEHPDLAQHTLVVAGARWWGGSEEEDAAEAVPDGVVFLGRVSDQEREWVLRLAEALAYVSLFEGFGLPPLEAMIRGTPALTSNVTSLPEVVGDAALQVDPTSDDEVAAGIVRILTDAELRRRLVPAGEERARSYDVARTGAAAVAAFTAAIAGG